MGSTTITPLEESRAVVKSFRLLIHLSKAVSPNVCSTRRKVFQKMSVLYGLGLHEEVVSSLFEKVGGNTAGCSLLRCGRRVN